ncbi:MAG: tetratricopeptide repeat protein, partial [Ignavibacteria bacterium]|nr:tetratricopeptide repeat protein [Ignavibacteria bacterium]
VVGDSLRYANVIGALFSNDVKLIRTFEGKINDIGNYWFDKERYAEAIAVFNLYLKAIPKSWNAFSSIAKAYIKNGQAERALTYFEKSLEINPNNSYAKEQIEELKRLLKKL